jgi:hypothetical protein
MNIGVESGCHDVPEALRVSSIPSGIGSIA